VYASSDSVFTDVYEANFKMQLFHHL